MNADTLKRKLDQIDPSDLPMPSLSQTEIELLCIKRVEPVKVDLRTDILKIASENLPKCVKRTDLAEIFAKLQAQHEV